MNVIKPDIALFYIRSLWIVHFLAVLAELLKATRKQHDGDGNCTTLPNAESICMILKLLASCYYAQHLRHLALKWCKFGEGSWVGQKRFM